MEYSRPEGMSFYLGKGVWVSYSEYLTLKEVNKEVDKKEIEDLSECLIKDKQDVQDKG